MAHPACVFVHLHGEHRAGRSHSRSTADKRFFLFMLITLLFSDDGSTMKNTLLGEIIKAACSS
jgi:hypothetical protein